MNQIFKALGDPTRREILEILRERDFSAGEIADRFNFSKPTISHHLELLHQAGLVRRYKEGQFVYYALYTTVLQEAYAWLLSISEKQKKKK
ncbi:MAG: autorepressor SdpR family transcription factor [Chitinophagales bacterium]|jgi:ArsR family transcriptional regulator|nr:autorepressor SdpR family transcription factor [Chitinophagales bacterium]